MQELEQASASFEAVRPRLLGLAYRMLGSRADAEDVVQDAYVRWHQADRAVVRNHEAWLVTTTTRLAIDRLRALRTARDAYRGPWLPEPLIGDPMPAPDHVVELASDLSVAFLVLLERLGPEERAAFLLHEVFELEYADIAAALGKTAPACRQIVHRARERVRQERKRFTATEAQKTGLLRRFVAAVQARDERTLLTLFAPDATWTADGGGQAPASPRPIVGAEKIARLVLGIEKGLARTGASLHVASVNGEPGVCAKVGDTVTGVLAIETDGDRILAVYAVVNPHKLGAPPPPG